MPFQGGSSRGGGACVGGGIKGTASLLDKHGGGGLKTAELWRVKFPEASVLVRAESNLSLF